MERHTGPEVEDLPPASLDAGLPLQMTLLTDRLAQGRFQASRIHDGVISVGGLRLAAPALLYVQLTGAMTAFAPNRQLPE
jgi:hypothetical protein